MFTIEGRGVGYRQLNQLIREALRNGVNEIVVKNVNGQRYIAASVRGCYRLLLEGVPGNDLAVYMDGPEIIVQGNAQDAVANSMAGGTVIIHGDAGDALGYAMSGGEVFVRGNVGYRAGIHLKEYQARRPMIVVGGKAGDFLGEYMAGGIIVVLGLPDGLDSLGNYCGTGMHGGVIYVRGEFSAYKLGREVRVAKPDSADMLFLDGLTNRFADYFSIPAAELHELPFAKLLPAGSRPYSSIYAKI